MVRLAAAEAYIDEIAERLDSGEEDLEVEGSIAKLFATEAADKAAGDAMQALGGYGYIAEYGVEKIKRDVKIACVYEGTSEIQQNIISTFRWKKTRKTRGEFYDGLAGEMEKGHADVGDAGCQFIALAARALNETITLVNDHRLTRQQFLMFALADMMTHVEVGISLARKANALNAAGDRETQKIKAMSRIFANDVAQLTAQNIIRILMGTGQFDQPAVSEFLEKVSYNELITSGRDVISDMDLVADILFGRK